jgi:DNA-directed RNA polymerase specialized sigma subunit
MGRRPVKPKAWHYRLFADNQFIVEQIFARIGGQWRCGIAGCERDDLLQAGLIGLWRAILRFDRKMGTQVRTLASKAIIGEMLECLDKARYGTRKRLKYPKIDQSQFERLSDD